MFTKLGRMFKLAGTPEATGRPYVYKGRTVLKFLTGAHLPIFTAIAIYIGLIVSDPATSPFYAIEAALTHVGHDHIVTTMLVVLGVALSVSIGYIAIGFRFNKGEGGTGLVFEWLGPRPAMVAAASLIVDFVLTDAVTMAAAVAAIVSFGVDLNRYLLAAIVFVVVGTLLRLGDKGRTIFATVSFGFMALVLITALSPILPNAPEILHEISHDAHAAIPDTSGVTGIALLSLIIFGAVRGFALITGFEASVAALSHEEEKPEYARVAMGVGTIILVLLFTSIVTYNISGVTKALELEPSHSATLFYLWTRVKVASPILLTLLSLFSAGILLSGSASGATAGGGLIHVLVKARSLPKSFTHIDNEHNDYKAMLIIHAIAGVVVLFFAVDELRIVGFYAISVLIGFTLSLLAAIKFALKTKTNYLLIAIPGFLMVLLALAINMFRFEGVVITAICLVLGVYLHKKWIKGGKVEINFSH